MYVLYVSNDEGATEKTVQKVWEGKLDEGESYPVEVKFRLLADGTPCRETAVSYTDGVLYVPNTPEGGYEMPETGGSGMIPFLLTGMLLLAVSMYAAVRRRRSSVR